MLVRRECYQLGSKSVCGFEVVPFIEAWVAVGDHASLRSCFAIVRPLGFALLTPDKGYWLAGARDLAGLARAVADLTEEARAS